MVRLFDIKEVNGVIQFICVPEGKVEDSFVVEIDKNTKKVVNNIKMSVDVSQAIGRIIYYLDNALELPKTEASVWY